MQTSSDDQTSFSTGRRVTRGRIPARQRSPGLGQLDQRDRLVRSADAFRRELLKHSRGAADNAVIELVAMAYHKALSIGSYLQYPGKADDSPSAELLRSMIAISHGLNSLGFTHNQPPIPPNEFPKLVINDTIREQE